MEQQHHEAVYEQIVEVSSSNNNNNSASQEADFVSHHLVQQEIVVPSRSSSDNNHQESNMSSCDITGMDIILPNDCCITTTVQDECNSRNVVISYSADGLESTKVVEHISHMNNSSSSSNTIEHYTAATENHKEVTQVQEYLMIHHQTAYTEIPMDSTSSIPLVENVSTSLVSLDTCDTTTTIITENDIVNESEVTATDITTDDNVVVLASAAGNKDIINLEPEKHFQIQNSVVASDDIAVMTEFSTIEYCCSTGEEKDQVDGGEEEPSPPACTLEEVEKKSRQVMEQLETSAGEQSNVQQQQLEKVEVKNELDENEMVIAASVTAAAAVIATDQEIIESKLESSVAANQVNYNQSSCQEEQAEIELHLTMTTQSATAAADSHRKVIQDIFDDWQDENCEEDNNSQSKDYHDSVEKELQNLLNDDVQQLQDTQIEKLPDKNNDDNETIIAAIGKLNQAELSPKKISDKSPNIKALKSTSLSSRTGRQSSSTRDKCAAAGSDTSSSLDTKKVHPRPGVKVPGSHLTSPIASTAEVAEALNKRLREKQKDLVVPKAADIVFVKKISQRLSNQLSQVVASMSPPAAPTLTAAALAQTLTVPAPAAVTTDTAAAAAPIDKNKSIEEIHTTTMSTPSKTSSVSDNNDLLAILEGDADPEWSNLKPETTTSSNSSSKSNPNSSSSSGKLDPAMERELALKQLLELPNITAAKKSKKVFGKEKESTTMNKAEKEQTRSKVTIKQEPRLLDQKTKDGEISSFDSALKDSPKKAKKTLKVNSQNTSRNNSSSRSSGEIKVEMGIEESSRSGRKRKLTEKAREHELAVKRQRVIKNKAVESKKLPLAAAAGENRQQNAAAGDDEESDKVGTDSESMTEKFKTVAKQAKIVIKTAVKTKVVPMKKSKIRLLKKNASITKKKLAVKNLLRQKVSAKSTTTTMTTTKKVDSKRAPVSSADSTPKKESGMLVAEKAAPTATGIASFAASATHKGKKVSEIDRLLQDEGVVNLLYDVEQPDSRKRLVPITKSQKKVMDVEKAERELKLRTKLVKNAVLRLRNSASATIKVSPRSRRSAAVVSAVAAAAADQSCVIHQIKPQKSHSYAPSEPTDFVIPAKIRNAADASRIIRRHSSSSFSSASASPRVSIDVPPAESAKLEELESLNNKSKTKRKHSHDSTTMTTTTSTSDNKCDAKKSKKKSAATIKNESDDNKGEDEVKSPSKRAAAKLDNKKVQKTSRSSSKILWNDVNRGRGQPPPLPSRDQDELSACLAEAASALQSSINGGAAGTTTSINQRKRGGHSKAQSHQSEHEKLLDIKKFSNKEINVRRHGHLVQLILTPSAPVSGIRNAITIPVMKEIRETLLILGNDDDCRVVLFTSTGTSFCEGLELSYLLQQSNSSNSNNNSNNKEERRVRAEEMANAVRDFVRSLVAFNKPIVAGVQGAAIGLGVTMLPLFDLVIASDKATFSTPYGKLGQIAEGAAVLTLSHSLGSAVTNELLLGGRTLTASEALRAGLVTRVLWPDRFQGELLPSLKVMSEQSAQSMETTKALLRHGLRNKLDAALESESFLLIRHWCSEEFQEAIKTYIAEKRGQ